MKIILLTFDPFLDNDDDKITYVDTYLIFNLIN